MYNKDFYDKLSNNLIEVNVKEYGTLSLAYLGDAVFELLVREKILKDNKVTVNKMHKQAREYVKAESQSKMYKKIEDSLSEKELEILKRGRNAKSYTSPKNGSITDYRHATGLETLFGYLFIEGDIDRILQIFSECIKD